MQRYIYHIVAEKDWEAARKAGSYAPPSLEKEGFIHCSDREFVDKVARRFYSDMQDLRVLKIDVEKLHATLRYDAVQDVEWGLVHFPHIYGELNVDAVEERNGE